MPRKKCLKQNGRNMRLEARAKSERAERELEGKLLPFSAFFFFSKVFFFLEKVFEIEGQKQEPKVKGQSRSIKESSLPSLHFIFFSMFFFPFSYA